MGEGKACDSTKNLEGKEAKCRGKIVVECRKQCTKSLSPHLYLLGLGSGLGTSTKPSLGI